MRVGILPVVMLLLLSALPMLSGADDGLVPTHGITIDEHWIDVIQSDNRKELEVNEYIFYNNTGSDIYNGSLYSWIPENALVLSSCCGDAPDMGCRMLESGAMLCFNIQHYDNNIVFGEPYPDYSFLSYFGQKAELSVVADSQNFTYSDSLFYNVTLGQAQIIGDYPNVTGEGIHITSDTEQLGVIAEIPFGDGMAEKLGMIVSLNVTNFTPKNDTIDLDLLGLPEGWSGVFIYGGGLVRSVSVPVNESREVILHVQVPSYMLEVQLNYFIPIEGASDSEGEYLFEKEMLYGNDFVEAFVFLLENDHLEEGEGLVMIREPQWDEGSERMWYSLGSYGMNVGDRVNFTVAWKNPADYSLLMLGAILVVLIILIAVIILRKRRRVSEAEEKSEAEKPTEIDRTGLDAKKEKILLAIKRLKEDYEAGNIPEDVYNDLLGQYKKSAIRIMKEMDKVR